MDNTSVPPGKHLTPPWMVPLPLLTVEERAVRILLECILVEMTIASRDVDQ